jgi:hypothetical protein
MTEGVEESYVHKDRYVPDESTMDARIRSSIGIVDPLVILVRCLVDQREMLLIWLSYLREVEEINLYRGGDINAHYY